MRAVASIIFLVVSGLAFCITQEERSRLIELANGGNAEAMYSLFIDVGERNNTDNKPSAEENEQAKQWLLKAGSLNNWRAAYVLQLCYTKGCWGLQPDSGKAAHFQEIVAKYGPSK